MDLIVVGASFAGLTCARAAAALGLRTRVLERKLDVGSDCRTTGILVKEAAEEIDIPRRFTRRIGGVRLYGPSLRWIDLASHGYYFLSTDTPQLLRWLAREAEGAGAELALGRPYLHAERDACGFRLPPSAAARFLVGADGAKSRVARDFALDRRGPCLIGIEAELTGVRGVDEDRLHCFLDSRLAPGYIAWLVPGVGITQVGLACSSRRRPRLDLFLARVQTIFDFSAARIVGRRAGIIPVGGPPGRLGEDGVLLAGDAAGLVSPLTAGGIHNALRFGRLAGRAVAEHLLDGGPQPWRALDPLVPRYRWKRWLRAAADLAPPNWLLDAVLGWPGFEAAARAIFFGERRFLRRSLPPPTLEA